MRGSCCNRTSGQRRAARRSSVARRSSSPQIRSTSHRRMGAPSEALALRPHGAAGGSLSEAATEGASRRTKVGAGQHQAGGCRLSPPSGIKTSYVRVTGSTNTSGSTADVPGRTSGASKAGRAAKHPAAAAAAAAGRGPARPRATATALAGAGAIPASATPSSIGATNLSGRLLAAAASNGAAAAASSDAGAASENTGSSAITAARAAAATAPAAGRRRPSRRAHAPAAAGDHQPAPPRGRQAAHSCRRVG